MNRKSQRGAALVLTIILIAVLSVMTASMMTLSQSEAWSTHNFKLTSLARDAAEAGLNRSAHFLMFDYTPPDATSATDPVTAYNYQTPCGTDYPYPVQVNGSCTGTDIILSADSHVTDNYPDATVQTDYENAAQGTISVGTAGTAGSQTVNYQTSAKLLGMRNVNLYAIGSKMIQRWEITSRGTINGVEGAEVELSAILDRTTQPTFGYAAFGVSDQCAPDIGLEFGGNTTTDSYDSTPNVPGSPTYDPSLPACDPALAVSSTNCQQLNTGGNLGTNGAMNVIGGTVDINGSLSTPREGVGDCDDGFATDNPDVLEEGLIQLDSVLEFPDPPFPGGPPSPLIIDQDMPPNASTCPLIPGCSGTSPLQKNHFVLAPGGYGNLGGGAQTVIHLTAGTYNINSLDLGASVQVVIDSGPVIINIAGCTAFVGSPPTGCAGELTNPLHTTGGSFTNESLIASNLQINYGGEGTLELKGTSDLSATVYAPSADVRTVGTANFYGAVVGYTIDWTGTSAIHYDRALENDALSYGPFMLQGFTWKMF